MEDVTYGTLIIPSKNGNNIEYPIKKKSILVGRDKECDIRIVNKEVSRKHVEIYVEEGQVFVLSMGREPISLNGERVLSPVALQTDDMLEVHLEGRSRIFYYKRNVQIPKQRTPLAESHVTNNVAEPGVEHLSPVQEVVAAEGQEEMVAAEGQEEMVAADGQDFNLVNNNNQDKMPVDDSNQEILEDISTMNGISFEDNLKGIPADEIDNKQQEEAALFADIQEEDAHMEEVQMEECAKHDHNSHGQLEEKSTKEVERNEGSIVNNDVLQQDEGANDVHEALNKRSDTNHDQTRDIDPEISRMVHDMFLRVLQATDSAVQALTPHSAVGGRRKSVRFQAGTPEGAPYDTTMTIRCRPKQGDRAIIVEDDTVAFAEWGFGTMVDEEAARVDTVLSKHSRRESVMNGGTPASIKKACKVVFSPEVSNKLNFNGIEVSQTPATTIGAKAPACTPVTDMKHNGGSMDKQLDFESLAQKLSTIANEHDITFELPKDFMRFTPMSASRSKRISLGDSDGSRLAVSSKKRKSINGEDPTMDFDLPQDFMRFTPLTLLNSKPQSSTEADIAPLKDGKRSIHMEGTKEEKTTSEEVEYDLPNDFMRFTPIAQKTEAQKQSSSTDGMAFDLPRGFMRFTPMTVVSKKKDEEMIEYDVAKDFMKFTPMTEPKRKSMANGEIEYDLPTDFMRFTPLPCPHATEETQIKSAIRAIAASVERSRASHSINIDCDKIEGEAANLRNLGYAVQGLANTLDAVASARNETNPPVQRKSPGLKIAIVERSAQKPGVKLQINYNDNRKELFKQENEVVEDAQQEKNHTVVSKPRKVPDVHNPSSKRFKAAILQAHSYRSQAMLLGRHLRRASSRAAKYKRINAALSQKLQKERERRLELQSTLKQLVQNREEEISQEKQVIEMGKATQRVIVVGYKEPENKSNIEMAGDVVVVRPTTQEATIAGTPVQQKNSVRQPVSLRTLTKTVRKTASGLESVEFTLDDVKVPSWVFCEEGKNGHDEAIDAETEPEEDDQHKAVLENLETSLKNEVEEDSEGEEADACHVCQNGDDGDVLLLCDSCDNACHLACCDPPLKRVPRGNWYCSQCKPKKVNSSRGRRTAAASKRKATEVSDAAPKKQRQTKENASKRTAAKGKTGAVEVSTARRSTRSRKVC